MADVTNATNQEMKEKFKKRFTENQDKIEALHLEMANCLMAEVALDILEKAPNARTLELEHLTEDYNEYNTVIATALLDENGVDLFEVDEEGTLELFVEDVLCNYSADFLILLPSTINLPAQITV